MSTKDITGHTVTPRAYWDGNQEFAITFRTKVDGVPTPPPPPPVTPMTFGVSATNGTFATGYAAQRTALHSKACYYYDASSNPTWSPVSTVNSADDIWFQTKAQTRAAYDALLASMPATRTGKVYLHYWNEPEDNVKAGTFTLADWQSHCDQLFASIAASGKTYVVPSAELQYFTLQQYNKGLLGTNDERDIVAYLRPGLKQLGFSSYAEVKVKGTSQVAGTDPTKSANTMKAFMDNHTSLGVSIITGFAVGSAYATDPTTLQNQINWLAQSASTYSTILHSKHYLWFDVPFANGDYVIENKPNLLAAWKDTLTAAGQW